MGSWHVSRAYPISLEVASFNSTSNALIIETLTLSYTYFKRAK